MCDERRGQTIFRFSVDEPRARTLTEIAREAEKQQQALRLHLKAQEKGETCTCYRCQLERMASRQ